MRNEQNEKRLKDLESRQTFNWGASSEQFFKNKLKGKLIFKCY